jgi:hypothetical protein
MDVTIEMIAKTLSEKYPEIVESPAFIALNKMASLRSVKVISVSLEMMTKDFNDAMKKEEKPKATAAGKEKPGDPGLLGDTAPVPETAQKPAPTMPTMPFNEVLQTINTNGKGNDLKTIKIDPNKKEVPEWLKDTLKDIK